MKTNEFGHSLYSATEIQEMFKDIQNKIDNNSELRNRIGQEGYDSIHRVANCDLTPPENMQKRRTPLIYSVISVLSILAIIGTIIYILLTF